MAEPSKRELLLKELEALDKERLEAEHRINSLSREERQIVNAGQPRKDKGPNNRFRVDRDRDVGRPGPNKRQKTQTPPERKRLPSGRNHDKMVDEEKEEGETTDDAKPNLSSVVVNDDEGEATGIEKKPDKKPAKGDAIFSRHKRMFGTLLGHLAKAQTRLKTDEKQQKAREETEARAAKKMEEYNFQVREQNLKLFREKKEKELEQMQKILKDHEEKEVALLEIVVADHLTKTSEYIRTKALPQLLWVPISHNEKTTKLLEDSKAEELKRVALGNLVLRASVVINGPSEGKTNGSTEKDAIEDTTMSTTKDDDGDEQLKGTDGKEGKPKEKEYSVEDEGT